MKDLKDKHNNRERYMLSMSKSKQIWLSELEKLAPNTQKGYKLAMRRFLEYMDTDYEGLYNLKLADMRSKDPRDMRRVERELSRFMFKQVREDGLAATTARRTGLAATHFMRTQGLNFQLMRNEWPKGEYQGQRMVLKHQIKAMYENASAWMRSRNRALMMFAKDSGLRISDISNLNVEDYLDARAVAHNGEVFKEFKPIVTQKTKALAYCVIGPEAVEAVDLYLEERVARRGEPLFIDDRGKRLKITAMSEQFRRFSDCLEDGDNISAHSFRKYHETMLGTAGIPLNWIKRYQGRKVTDSTGPYSNPQQIPDKLLNTYIENYDVLRVFTDKHDLERLKNELVKQKTQHDSDLANMKAEVEEMRGQLQLLAQYFKDTVLEPAEKWTAKQR